jgi:hypothetical protein
MSRGDEDMGDGRGGGLFSRRAGHGRGPGGGAMNTYQMIDGLILVDGAALTYEQLQNRVEWAMTELRTYQGALEYLREHLTLEQASARYAVGVNTGWALAGIKGGNL